MKRATRQATSWMMLILIAATAGCSSFERDWQAAAESPPADDDPIAGRWVGDWRSNHNDHTGDLRAIVTPEDDGQYHVHYHATYGGIFTYAYEIQLAVEPREDAHHFTGEADLGWFGTYSHEGHATADEFHADYESTAGDHGIYRMTRPEDEATPQP